MPVAVVDDAATDDAARAARAGPEVSPGVERGAACAISVVSGAVVAWATGARGLGVSNDSVAYAATAQSIARGAGAGYWLQNPLTSWPLGYPTLLALVTKVSGLAVFDAARVLAIVVAITTTFAVWHLMRHVAGEPVIRLAVTVAVAAAPATLALADHLLSDQLFSLVSVLFVMAAMAAVRTPGPRRVVLLIGITWALCCVRYVGVLYIPLGASILLAVPAAPMRRRVRDAAVYAAGASVVPVVYALWNRSTSGSYLGMDRSNTGDEAASSLRVMPQTVIGWATGRTVTAGWATLAGLAVMAVLLAVAVRALAFARRDGTSSDIVVLAATFVGLVVGFAALRLAVHFDLDARTMGALFPVTAAFVGTVADGALGARPRGYAAMAGLIVVAVWALGIAAVGVHDATAFRAKGSGYVDAMYDDVYRELRDADLGSHLPTGCPVLSNQPNVLYIAGVPAQYTPTEAAPDPAGLAGSCVVWFRTGQPGRPDLAPLASILEHTALHPVYEGATFSIYEPT